jgi:DNA-binding transcriptional ArsR family regulator
MPASRTRRRARPIDSAAALRRFKADVFQVLGHPTRIHIAETLRDGRRPVHEILRQVGVEPANLSQHLAVLRAKGLVVKRREGSQVVYALRDPLLIVVLDAMREYFHAHLEEALSMLAEIEEE